MTRPMKAFGKVDILVNNAGVSRAGAFETLTDERMQEDLDQKLFAAIRMTRLVWPQMKERRWGRVINVLNIGAKAPRAASAPTSISRAAGMALTKVLAGEGAPHNVLVNALLVGIIEADQHVQAAKRTGVADRRVYGAARQDDPARPSGQGGGVRQHRLLPRLRSGRLCHGNGDQRGRRNVAGRVARTRAASVRSDVADDPRRSRARCSLTGCDLSRGTVRIDAACRSPRWPCAKRDLIGDDVVPAASPNGSSRRSLRPCVLPRRSRGTPNRPAARSKRRSAIGSRYVHRRGTERSPEMPADPVMP